eukprot:TRINITY_DN106778_c0_g1_i1.p1 TRINITY_DN106778_c0_g1~~TRINITY_DN106778_c0_g1_i1.p1  ORF type:complete len:408 (-),score=75.57 TRINITY_DN106778_c0_g1_i1:23-1246(-)
MASPAKLRRVATLRGHEERVWHVSWRPQAKPPQLASCGSDLVVRLWGAQAQSADLKEEAAWVPLAELDATDRHTRTLRSTAWSPDGRILAVVSFDATTSLWKEVSSTSQLRFECITVLSGHENEVKSAAFSPSGKLFATCSRDRSVWIYDAEDTEEYECMALLQSHTQDVKMLKWHPAQDVLFSCSYDDTIKVWGPDGDDWCCKETLEGHKSTVWGLSFDAGGSRFVTCSDDRSLRIWSPAGNASRANGEAVGGYPDEQHSRLSAAAVHTAGFLAPLFRRGAGLAATAAAPETDSMPSAPVRAVPSDASCGWSCTSVIEGQHPRPVYSVDWRPFGVDSVASACGDNRLRIFQSQDARLSRWTCVAEEEAHKGDVNSVAWCREPQSNSAVFLASAGDDAAIVIWEFVG